MKILSILVGKPKQVAFRRSEISTGIYKTPVLEPVMLRSTNLDGDGQADLKVHGGRDKALYAYPVDAYPSWKALRPRDSFEMGAMGENLAMDQLDERRIFLGDTYRLGGAIVQVTQPRFPCFKLGVKFGDPKIVDEFLTINRPGVYYRVLQEGLLTIGDVMTLVDQEEILVSVQEIFEMTSLSDANPHRLAEILKVKSLNEKMRRKFQKFVY